MTDEDDKIVKLRGGDTPTSLSHKSGNVEVAPPDEVLKASIGIGLTEVVVVGRTETGEVRIASSHNVAYANLLAGHAVSWFTAYFKPYRRREDD